MTYFRVFSLAVAIGAAGATAQGAEDEECYPGLADCEAASQAPMKINIGTPDESAPAVQDVEPPAETAGPSGVSKNGDWFVIAGSFSTDAGHEATQRLVFLQNLGLNAEIILTDHYPRLSNDLLAVVVASYTRDEAFRKLENVKGHVPDAYVKAGR